MTVSGMVDRTDRASSKQKCLVCLDTTKNYGLGWYSYPVG